MKNINNSDRFLIEEAKKVVLNNYTPDRKYSTVGVALRCKSGAVYIGVNIESNQACCAEAVAIGNAISSGEREFDTIVAVNKKGDIISPCGKCRQLLFDCAKSCNVIIMADNQKSKVTVDELLPFAFTNTAFTFKQLKKK